LLELSPAPFPFLIFTDFFGSWWDNDVSGVSTPEGKTFPHVESAARLSLNPRLPFSLTLFGVQAPLFVRCTNL